MGFEQEKNMSDLEYQPWVRNEANKNSKGGSELMMEGIVSRMDPELLSHFQLIASRVREIREDKIRIYHLHDLPEDPETNHLKNSSSRDRFHKQVYCGNWQYARYRGALGVPHDGSCVVLETAIDPLCVRILSQQMKFASCILLHLNAV